MSVVMFQDMNAVANRQLAVAGVGVVVLLLSVLVLVASVALIAWPRRDP